MVTLKGKFIIGLTVANGLALLTNLSIGDHIVQEAKQEARSQGSKSGIVQNLDAAYRQREWLATKPRMPYTSVDYSNCYERMRGELRRIVDKDIREMESNPTTILYRKAQREALAEADATITETRRRYNPAILSAALGFVASLIAGFKQANRESGR